MQTHNIKIVKIEIKGRLFETANELGNSDINYLVDEMLDGASYHRGTNTITVVPKIKNFRVLLNVILTREFTEWYRELMKAREEKIQSEKKETSIDFLYPFQKEAVDKMVNSKYNGFLLSFEQGLGKTVTSTVVMEEKKKEHIWVLAPATLLSQWKDEIIKWTKCDESTIQILRGEKKKRPDMYKNKKRWNIISYETLRTDLVVSDIPKRGLKLDLELMKILTGDSLIVDEASKLKNKKSKVYRALRTLCRKLDYKIFLTGTPVSDGLQDVDNIFKLIDKDITGNINDYVIWEQKTSGWGKFARIWNEPVGYKNLDVYIEKIKPVYTREIKEVVASQLPKKSIIRIDVPQTPTHHSLKKQILKVKTAFTGFTLLQILDGGVEILQGSNSEDIDLLEFPKNYTNPKVKLLKDMLLEIDSQVLIFTRFTKTAEMLKTELEKEFKNKTIKLVTGSTKNNELTKKEFNERKTIDIVIATDTWAKGVDLNDVDYEIQYDIPTSIEVYLQRQDRIHRLSSTKPKFIYNLVGDVIENHIMELLHEKLLLIEKITEGRANVSEMDIKNEVIKRLGFSQ